jgi:hypothetical protein
MREHRICLDKNKSNQYRHKIGHVNRIPISVNNKFSIMRLMETKRKPRHELGSAGAPMDTYSNTENVTQGADNGWIKL